MINKSQSLVAASGWGFFRFILPDASIRLAGGRGLLEGHGRDCFESGANAVISGDMLTTSGYTIESDMKMIHELGYKEELWEEIV